MTGPGSKVALGDLAMEAVCVCRPELCRCIAAIVVGKPSGTDQ